MNDWEKHPETRRAATIAFCKHLHDPANAGQRAECKTDSDKAKRLFAELGSFYVEGDQRQTGDEEMKPIPAATKFLVYETDEIPPRDALVTLILPSQKTEIDPTLDAEDVYRCTWIAWASK